MISFAKYQWHFLSTFRNSEILIVLVILGFIGSFLELFVIKLGDLKKRSFYKLSNQNVHRDIYKLVEVLSVRLALSKTPQIEIFNDSRLIIKIIYNNFNTPKLLISTKCIEAYTVNELEFALALKLVSIKNGNDSALKIYRGFVGIIGFYSTGNVQENVFCTQHKTSAFF
jgi:Zn-dependent protease with chaperone function